MTKSKFRRVLAIVLVAAFAALTVIGAVNLPKKSNASGETILNDLRTRSLLNATGDGVVESYVAIAKKQAQEQARLPAAAWQKSAKPFPRQKRIPVQNMKIPK